MYIKRKLENMWKFDRKNVERCGIDIHFAQSE